MRSGKPLFMVYSGYPSLVKGDLYCFQVKDYDIAVIKNKLMEVIDMPKEKLDDMGSNAKEIVEKYHTFTELSQNYLRIFDEIYCEDMI